MSESLAYARRGIKGGAAVAHIPGGLAAGVVGLVACDDLTSWVGATANGPHRATLNRGSVSQEEIEISAVSGNNITIAARGLAGTTDGDHDTGVTIELTSSPRDFDEANELVAMTLGLPGLTAGDTLYWDGASFARAPLRWFDVTNYGTVGNGVANDTAAVQAAIDAAGDAGGGIVWFPKGIYLINTVTSGVGLLVPSNVTLQGAGPNASIIRQGFALPGSVEGNALIGNEDTVAGNTFINLYDLGIECRVVTGSTPNLSASTIAVRFQGVSDTQTRGCRFDSGTLRFDPLPAVANTANVHTTGKNNRHKVIGNTFGRGGEALYFQQGTDLVVADNIMLNAYDSTLSINSSGERIVIANNVMDKQGNTFDALGHIEVTNDAAGDSNGIRDIAITGNVLLNGANAACRGVQLQRVTNAVVTGNTIRGNLGDGIRVGVVSSKITIADNTIDVPAGGGTGIYLTNDGVSSDILIEDNNVISAATGANGIATGGDASTLTNISIVENKVRATVNNGIRNDANVTNGICANNNVAGSASSINQGGATGWTYRDNYGYNPLGFTVTTPAVPASTVTATNSTGVDVTAYVAGGTVTAISVDGTATGLITGAIRVPAGSTIAITYSAAPTWKWYGA